jgi:hypothetical protein
MYTYRRKSGSKAFSNEIMDELPRWESTASLRYRRSVIAKEIDTAEEDEKKREALNSIYSNGDLVTSSADSMQILWFNCLSKATTVEEGCDKAVELCIDSFESLINFNGIMAGFMFVGLTIGDAPDTVVQVAAYFCVTLGFGAAVVGTLIAFLAVWYLRTAKGEPTQFVIQGFFQWNPFFYLAYMLTISGVTCLTVGVNIMVHDFFTDIDPFPCFRSKHGTTCNSGQHYKFMAIVLNVISLLCFFLVSRVWYGTILGKNENRQIYHHRRSPKIDRDPDQLLESSKSIEL